MEEKEGAERSEFKSGMMQYDKGIGSGKNLIKWSTPIVDKCEIIFQNSHGNAYFRAPNTEMPNTMNIE